MSKFFYRIAKKVFPDALRGFGAFVLSLAGAALGAYLSTQSNVRVEHQQRMEDALIDVYFNPETMKGLSPAEIAVKQSILREKFALLANDEALKKLDAIESSHSDCPNELSSEQCAKRYADELWIQRSTSGEPTSASDEAAFKRIIVREKKEQASLVLPGTVDRFRIFFPSYMDLKGDDLPSIKGRVIPSDFSKRFPTTKYVIMVQLYDDKYKKAKKGDLFGCGAIVGITYQPAIGHLPEVPNYNEYAQDVRRYTTEDSERECLVDVGDRVIDGFLSTPVAELEAHIN
jgi:hypothetical protein